MFTVGIVAVAILGAIGLYDVSKATINHTDAGQDAKSVVVDSDSK